MATRSRNVNIRTPRVVVSTTPGQIQNNANVKKSKTKRRSQRGFRNLKRELINIESGISSIEPGPVQQIAYLEEMESGRMTNEPMPTGNFLQSLRNQKCCMDGNTEGWYYKYLDPAGSVETARAIGEFSKIPDGLLTFSVDAEIRTLDTLAVPFIESETPGELPVTSGFTWSLTIFSYPMFRTAYIAVANRFDREISATIAGELAYALNNLLDYRATIDSNMWIPFAVGIDDGWYFWIKPLPPTYNLADPVSGDQRSLTSYRLSYKSLTIEHNAPTLVDQGFWIGGQFALDPTQVQQSGQTTEGVVSYVHGSALVNWDAFTPADLRIRITIPNLPQVLLTGGNGVLNVGPRFDVTVTGDISASGSPITFTLQPFNIMYNPFEQLFADDSNIITITAVSAGPGVVISSDRPGSTPVLLNFSTTGSIPIVIVGTESLSQVYLDIPAELFGNRASNQIEFPAYNPSQIAANNPKMEQFLMKETNGAYVVHKKMRKPVFEVTPAGSFGPVQFTTPDYDIARNTSDGSGILDTIDANLSTISVCVRGIAHANVIVVKLYQGWEGVTNVNTPFGQFGHSGLERNDSVMQLVDNLTVRTTGIYPANDNFLGMIAKFAAGALKSLLSSEATSNVLGNLAQGVVNRGLSSVNNRLTKYAR